jgi:hypothetical protein
MIKQIVWLTVVAVVALAGMGFSYLGTATNSSRIVAEDVRRNGLIAGITCLVLATGLVVFSAFRFGRGSGTPRDGSGEV